ncbi:hypothetical protein GS4_23_01250 [Gordonia soli NBRC 108243]|uniref:Uncharacterized protein n=2 Tax=Gordonia soli TaxID=320799 RepID=M0QL92_9ACTN|nr:hypothetical protein GS4_23_01250 [Gordonia soli NBRC 108243]
MDQFKQAFEQASDTPDVPFTIDPAPAPAVPDQSERLSALNAQIAQLLAQRAPAGWRHLGAVIALTPTHRASRLAFDVDGQAVRVPVPDEVWPLLAEQRDIAATVPAGPWLRLLVDLTPQGQLSVSYDYGDEPYGEEFLFPAEAYRADLQRYGDRRLPLWLAAHTFQEGRQLRTPQVAAERARIDSARGVSPTSGDDDFPPLHDVWTRWAAISSVFVALQSPSGPRILPATGWFEGNQRSGATLVRLPGDRAILSGGVWDARELADAYLSGGSLPDLYRGAPAWVTNVTLNNRIEGGLLTFCYWYSDGHWFKGDSPPSDECADAVPAFWAADVTADVIARVLADNPSETLTVTANAFVSACESGTVTRTLVESLFAPADRFDIDWALNQLSMAGCYRE